MTSPVVAIVKASPWKYAYMSMNHPEYLAISKLIDRHADNVNFVLTGTTKASIYGFRMRHNVIAWDLPINGKTGDLAYYMHLFRLFLQNRPRLIIILGLPQLIPALIFSFLSPKSICAPVFMLDGFEYIGRKVSGKFLTVTQFKLMSLALRVSRVKIPAVFALSKFTRDGIERMAPNLTGKITLVSYPIPPKFHSPKQSSEIAHENTILTVAGIEPRKGLDILVRAISLIPTELRPKVIIKGEIRDPFYMQQLNTMVDNLALRDWIEFDTRAVDYDVLSTYYRFATLFVFPTRQDSLGVVVLEALHSGLPVIATSVGGIPDMVETGANGLLVEPDNPEKLADAVMLILKDEKLRLSLARNTVRVLKNRYYDRPTLEEAFEKSVGLMRT